LSLAGVAAMTPAAFAADAPATAKATAEKPAERAD